MKKPLITTRFSAADDSDDDDDDDNDDNDVEKMCILRRQACCLHSFLASPDMHT